MRKRKSCYRPYGGRRIALWQRVVLVLIAAALACFGVLEGVVLSGAKTQVASGADAPEVMVIFGCKAEPWGPSELLRDRLDTALDYLEEHPDMKVVVTGGQGSDEPVTEAQCMYDYLTAHGVEPGRLILEDQASNTAENFALSKPLLYEAGVDPAEGRVAVVTNDFHIARAELIAAREGYGDVAGIPAPLPWVHLEINYTLREAFAMVKTFLFD